jgi:hypothetical protein
MATASDLADWWEKNRQQTAGYSDRALTDYVQAHPGLFAVVVAGSAQTAVEFPMAIGAGFVDLLRLGKGAAEGGFGYLQDGLRFISIAAPLARGGQAILSRVLAAGTLDNCTWIAATKALQATGTRPFALVRDLANAAGLKTSATGGAFIDELLAALRQLGAKVRLLPNPGSLNDVLQAASGNRNGAVVFSVTWRNAAFTPPEVGHSLVAAWDAAANVVRFADRSGRVISSLAELERLYPGIGSATPYGTMAFIENALIPQAALLAGGVGGSIYDAVALQLSVVFSPAPEIVAKARSFPTRTAGQRGVQQATVAAGDSISKIAQRCYGDMLLWPVIYDANRATVGANPNLVRPGQTLTVPDIGSFTPSQLNAARQRGRNWR